MSVELKHFNDATITPKDDARINHLKIPYSGVISGCVVTSLGSNQLHITDGYGIIQGRLFNVTAQDISAVVSDSGTKRGRLILVVDLTNLTTPIEFDTQMAATLPALVQDDLNDVGTDFELPLAEYDISATTISNLADVSDQVTGKIKGEDLNDGIITDEKLAVASAKIIQSLKWGVSNFATGQDVDDYIVSGTYLCLNTTLAATLVHTPFVYAFKLFVDYILGGTTYIVQIARAIDGAEKRRFTYDGGAHGVNGLVLVLF